MDLAPRLNIEVLFCGFRFWVDFDFGRTLILGGAALQRCIQVSVLARLQPLKYLRG
jgi:hypothetical protein